MQRSSLPFSLVSPLAVNGDLSQGSFEVYRALFLGSLLFFQGDGGMDISKVGEKILSSVRSARSLGILPSSSDRPEVITLCDLTIHLNVFIWMYMKMHHWDPQLSGKGMENISQTLLLVPARAAAAAAIARALAGLPPHQRYNLSSSSDELSSIYGSRPRGQVVEELEEEFYEEDFDPVKHILEHIPSEENEVTYFEGKATLRLAQLDTIAERLSRHVMEHHEEMGKLCGLFFMECLDSNPYDIQYEMGIWMNIRETRSKLLLCVEEERGEGWGLMELWPLFAWSVVVHQLLYDELFKSLPNLFNVASNKEISLLNVPFRMELQLFGVYLLCRIKGMHLVRELERDLKIANVICMNGRRHLTSSRNEVSRDLIVTTNSKRKQALLDMLPILNELRHALDMQVALESNVEEGKLFTAFQVLSEYLQLLDSFSELSAIQEMSRGVEIEDGHHLGFGNILAGLAGKNSSKVGFTSIRSVPRLQRGGLYNYVAVNDWDAVGPSRGTDEGRSAISVLVLGLTGVIWAFNGQIFAGIYARLEALFVLGVWLLVIHGSGAAVGGSGGDHFSWWYFYVGRTPPAAADAGRHRVNDTIFTTIELMVWD
ncbi:hypothetical protein RJ639_001697 [Escallonia herrerae]|uniref:Vacuolar protein sorting-associated protein 54 N-terminal domain-containing protein n=1 Tax=Escallonia herrerae TaxID=1293975 RepID=A0AA89BII4_9ASTE|nr:hypothetical protein RJ639_001697 [Escallonia herrerae]